MKSTGKLPQKLLNDHSTYAIEEIEVFRVIAQEYFTEDSDEEMEATNWIRQTDSMEQERLLIQIAWELWQEATWSGQIDYNLGLL
ncbi:2861_t:CDS:2 [Gigaspora rosea]|nr:2861_t:CDS:2 [Gigaspora rosea]